ncbi:MAG TPA: 3-deoxy-manno-octulosonate cytidylyltransferase [Candidatus Limnocylindrales bacterium]|nr:3-deoxy-manno-octulosonate cytidylyltransferase [Candidatus Limnocylindrales bacterium]
MAAPLGFRAVAIIPARLASTRLQRKVLREIGGKQMLHRVYDAARACSLLADVIIATDSEEVLQLAQSHGWKAEMTSSEHRSGTDRVYEIAQRVPADVYINVQGDEPLARPEHLEALLNPMRRPEIMVSTIATPCGPEDVANPNAVKVVTAQNGRALYFSRSTIPFDRDKTGKVQYSKHLGFYAYRPEALAKFCKWPESRLEAAERLEQLRFLDNGMDIYVEQTPFNTVGVDTEEDLKRVEQIILNG